MSNPLQQELREEISDIFARVCKNNEYFGNDGWYELHTPTLRIEILALFERMAREVIGEDEYYPENWPFVRSVKMQAEIDELCARDDLRHEQRKRLEALIKGER